MKSVLLKLSAVYWGRLESKTLLQLQSNPSSWFLSSITQSKQPLKYIQVSFTPSVNVRETHWPVLVGKLENLKETHGHRENLLLNWALSALLCLQKHLINNISIKVTPMTVFLEGFIHVENFKLLYFQRKSTSAIDKYKLKSNITPCVYVGFNARPLQYNDLQIQNGGWVIGAPQLVQDGQEYTGNAEPAKHPRQDPECKCFRPQQEMIEHYVY